MAILRIENGLIMDEAVGGIPILSGVLWSRARRRIVCARWRGFRGLSG